eukprot:783240-Pyramimonas_sp.AAC.1
MITTFPKLHKTPLSGAHGEEKGTPETPRRSYLTHSFARSRRRPVVLAYIRKMASGVLLSPSHWRRSTL